VTCCRAVIRRGYEIVMAVDGAEGIAAAKAENPDLVLMDGEPACR
jgi:CheY-like chemotaxis protein